MIWRKQLLGVWMKGKNRRLQSKICCHLLATAQDLLVPRMHAVKIPDCHCARSKIFGQIVEIPVHLHRRFGRTDRSRRRVSEGNLKPVISEPYIGRQKALGARMRQVVTDMRK